METLQSPWALIFGALVLFYAVRCIYHRLEISMSRHRTSRKLRCEPIKRSRALNTYSNNVFGWKVPLLLMKAFKARNVLDTLQKVIFEGRNTVQVKSIFTSLIFTVEPENLKEILASNFNDWTITARRKYAFDSYIGPGIFTAEGLAWKHSRELLRPNFARSQIDNPMLLEPHVATLLNTIPTDGSVFDLQEFFFRLTTDTALEFLFGLDSTASRDPITKFTGALDHMMGVVVRTAYFGRLMKIFKSFVNKDINSVHEFIDHRIDLAIKDRKNYSLGRTEGERYVFLHELVQRAQDLAQIRSEVLNVLVAGRNTTASLLSSLWFTLAKRPDIRDNLRAEVDHLNGAKPSFAALQEMKYLKSVLNETLRLYPVVPVVARTAKTDTSLPVGGGENGKSPLFIPKGQMVAWSNYNMHRRKDIYGDDADKFRPERWETLRPGWAYLPFAGGPRICLGQKFALTEAAYVTVRLMQEFQNLQSHDPEPWRERLSLSLAVGNGVKVSMKAR